jgi:hypothetical protein
VARWHDFQEVLPGFEPPRGHAPAHLDAVLTRIEEIAEKITSCIDVVRPKRKVGTPIERADIIQCRNDIAAVLRASRLPVPDDAWLDELIIELASWWHGFTWPPTSRRPQSMYCPAHHAFDCRALRLICSTDEPRVGWDPWADDY